MDSSVTLSALEEQSQTCTACRLCETRRAVVFGEGNLEPKIMIVGEGPGADEDATGRPFVGKSGQLLDKILGAVNLARADIYIGNMVKCRPPANRAPEPDEVLACNRWLEPQLALLRPQVILTLGNTPTRYLLGLQAGITRTRGTWHRKTFAWGTPLVMPMFHPAYLLRNDTKAVGGPKSLTWRDIKEVVAVLSGKEPEGLAPAQDALGLF